MITALRAALDVTRRYGLPTLLAVLLMVWLARTVVEHGRKVDRVAAQLEQLARVLDVQAEHDRARDEQQLRAVIALCLLQAESDQEAALCDAAKAR